VLPSVDFNDEAALVAHKIENVFAQRNLAAKAEAIQAMRTQCVPKPSLGIGHCAPQ
jgi:hypothetical protein